MQNTADEIEQNAPAEEALSPELAARDKNRDEYNQTADHYDRWCQENILMQQLCYYSTFSEL